MENTQSNIVDLNAAREAKAAADAPNLTAKQAAEIIIATCTPSMVEHIANSVPFRLAPLNCGGGHFNISFPEEGGGMNLDVNNLAVESRIDGVKPDRTDFMLIMGMFLIQQAEAVLRGLQVQHLTKQLEELEQSGAVKLGPTVSPELMQMLANMQQSGTEVTDKVIAQHDAATASTAANDANDANPGAAAE